MTATAIRRLLLVLFLVLLFINSVHRGDPKPLLVNASYVDQCGKAQPDLLDPLPKDRGNVIVRQRNGGIA